MEISLVLGPGVMLVDLGSGFVAFERGAVGFV